MATGVEPRDSDFEFTRDDVDRLSDAFKNKEFRKMLSDYCDEMTDPSTQALYQKEMTQLEKERGMDIVFINPEPGYVIKTSVAGIKKAFINICSNINVGKPSYFVRDNKEGRGLEWKIPYSLASPHEDLDKKRDRCIVYDVVFHPNTLKFADRFHRFKKLVNKTACDALESNFTIVLDMKNVRFPKIKYKGHPIPTVIRTANPNFKPDSETQSSDPSPLDELYPQQSYPPPPPEPKNRPSDNKMNECLPKQNDTSLYTIPKYVIKQQRDVDIQEFTFAKTAKQYCAIPNSIIVQINLPLISSTADCQLDVNDKKLSLICEKPAKYKLDLTLPYSVNDECGSAKFDKSKRMLIVTLPVVKNNFTTLDHQKQDSGVESDNNSCSDEDIRITAPLITELNTDSNPVDAAISFKDAIIEEMPFLDKNLLYSLPSYTINSLDDIIAYTFHVKNVEPDSVETKRLENCTVQLKFTSMGSGYVPVYFAAYLLFPVGYEYEDVTTETWDNNVILQVKMCNGRVPDNCYVGLDSKSTKTEIINAVISTEIPDKEEVNHTSPVVEVMISKGDEVSISICSSRSEESNQPRDIPKAPANDCAISISSGSGSYKGILRYPSRMARSLSESSVDCRDFSSSIDCVSSDCIPEESSLKKTVRFNDVIAKQVFRSNSSILGQKKKNQRKSRNKKKSLERRLSESEPDEPTQAFLSSANITMKKEKCKQQLDSGLSETSDGEAAPKQGDRDYGNFIKHCDKFYDPDKLNKGKYQEVAFKNDLIFDLDM